MADVALLLRGSAEAPVLAAQLAFHLAIGVERIYVVPTERASSEAAGPAWTDERVVVASSLAEARAAALECDWLIEADSGEFWWPRAGSLVELLEAIPSRYHTVNAFTRPLVVETHDDGDPAAHAVAREAGGATAASTRPLHRAAMGRWLMGSQELPRPGDPLRSWYPVEVLILPPAGRSTWSPDAIEAGIAAGAVVRDTRLRDALKPLRSDELATSLYRLPQAGEQLTLSVPSLVDEARYAVDVARCGESEPEAIRGQLAQLEARLAALESGGWRRIARGFARRGGRDQSS